MDVHEPFSSASWQYRCRGASSRSKKAAGDCYGTESLLRQQDPRFCEGSFGSYLLEHDIGVQDLTLGPDGKAAAIGGNGLGVEVDEERLERLISTLEGT
jgi:hypothetical protein